MNRKVLLVYATRTGFTTDVAAEIGRIVAQAEDLTVDVFPIDSIDETTAYDAVIIGSSVRAGRWLPEAVQFVKNHQEALARVPVAYFTVCMTLKDDTPDNRNEVQNYLEPVRQLVPPVSEGYFAGGMNFNKLSWLLRMMMKTMKAEEGDFRNWDQIDNWAASLRSVLAAETSPAGVDSPVA